MKNSIFETQSFCIVIETCTYLSIVKATVACPKLLETVFTSTPFCRARVAYVCPYGIIGKNGEALILQGVAPFAAAKSVPFQP